MPLNAPTPTIKKARQFFTGLGDEVFYAEAHGRRPDVPDTLRALGSGPNREIAQRAARENWQDAWRSLHPALRVADA